MSRWDAEMWELRVIPLKHTKGGAKLEVCPCAERKTQGSLEFWYDTSSRGQAVGKQQWLTDQGSRIRWPDRAGDIMIWFASVRKAF